MFQNNSKRCQAVAGNFTFEASCWPCISIVFGLLFLQCLVSTSPTAACVAKALGANGKKLLQDDNDEDRVDDVVGFYEPG